MSLYVSVAEFKQAPTQVDTSTLDITNVGNQSAQDVALLNVLRRASAWVDRIVQMPTLQATTNTEVKEINVRRDGRITIWPDMGPIVALTSVGYRMAPNVPFTNIPLEYVQPFKNRFTVWNINSNTLSPTLILQSQGISYYSPYDMARLREMPIQMQYTYVNGYFNSVLKGAVTAGATEVTFANALGLQAGSSFTLYDGADTEESITVDHIDANNANLVYLTSPLVFDHADKTPASDVKFDAVKQATILLASNLVKQRGSSAVIMGETNLQGATTKFNDNRDVEIAKELLAPFVRVISTSD